MGRVGHFGNIIFYSKTNSKGKPRVQSFSDMKWDTSVNVEEHQRQGKKPLLEVTSRNSDEISMNIYFMANYGINPWKKLLLLRKYNLQNMIYPLMLGGRRVGSHKWLITKVSNDLKTFYKNGKVLYVMAAVTFKEYPIKKSNSSKKKKLVSSKKKSASGTVSSTSKKKNKKGYIAYVIKKGDTLWALAKKYYKSGVKYTKIYNANKTKSNGFHVISDPDKLQPGWKIKIPQ